MLITPVVHNQARQQQRTTVAVLTRTGRFSTSGCPCGSGIPGVIPVGHERGAKACLVRTGRPI